MTKRTILVLGMISALVLVFTGGLYAAETLSLLTWKGYAPKNLVEQFEKETGITVKVTYSNNEEMIAKLRATRGAGFDLAQPSQDRISSVQEKYQIYQPIDLSKINTAQIIPSMLKAVQLNTMVDVKSHAVPFCWGTSGLIVNRKFAADAKDYSDLLNEAYKGRVSYRLKRPTLIAIAFAMGDDPFAKYSDVNAYQALMEKVGQALIDTVLRRRIQRVQIVAIAFRDLPATTRTMPRHEHAGIGGKCVLQRHDIAGKAAAFETQDAPVSGVVAEEHHAPFLDVQHDIGVGMRLVVVHDREAQPVDLDHHQAAPRLVGAVERLLPGQPLNPILVPGTFIVDLQYSGQDGIE